jgi:hypothetical protein
MGEAITRVEFDSVVGPRWSGGGDARSCFCHGRRDGAPRIDTSTLGIQAAIHLIGDVQRGRGVLASLAHDDDHGGKVRQDPPDWCLE